MGILIFYIYFPSYLCFWIGHVIYRKGHTAFINYSKQFDLAAPWFYYILLRERISNRYPYPVMNPFLETNLCMCKYMYRWTLGRTKKLPVFEVTNVNCRSLHLLTLSTYLWRDSVGRATLINAVWCFKLIWTRLCGPSFPLSIKHTCNATSHRVKLVPE